MTTIRPVLRECDRDEDIVLNSVQLCGRRECAAGGEDFYPFLRYASEYVLNHADEAAQQVSQESFLRDFPLRNWISISNALGVYEKYSDEVTLCYIAAAANLARLLDTLCNDGAWHHVPTERYQLPVIVAFANGHQQALRSLLGAENSDLVDEMSWDPGYGKPDKIRQNIDVVSWSAERENLALSKYLHESLKGHGIPIDPRFDATWKICNDLKLAARHGVTARLDLIVKSKGNMAVVDADTYRDAISSVCGSGKLDLVRLLVDGAIAQPDLLQVALEEVIPIDCLELVRHVLDCLSPFQTRRSVHYGRALCIAADNDAVGVVQLFLDYGIDVNEQSQDYLQGNALHVAASKGNVELVQLLLAAGADVNTVGGQYGNALQAAAASGNIEIVRSLLDKGAECNAHGGLYGTALQAACSKNSIDIARLLLDGGTDVNARGGDYGSAMDAARSHEMRQLFLNYGAT